MIEACLRMDIDLPEQAAVERVRLVHRRTLLVPPSIGSRQAFLTALLGGARTIDLVDARMREEATAVMPGRSGMQELWEKVREGAKEPVKLVPAALVAAAVVGVLGTGVFVVGTSFADTLPAPHPAATSTATSTSPVTSSVSPSATPTSTADAH
jgi:hypothetical protein